MAAADETAALPKYYSNEYRKLCDLVLQNSPTFQIFYICLLSQVRTPACGINNINFHTHHSVYKLMENETFPAHLFEAAAMNAIIEDQTTTLTKISLIFSNLSKDFRNIDMWKDGPTLHPRMSTARHFQIVSSYSVH